MGRPRNPKRKSPSSTSGAAGTMASRADKFALYLESVQAPDCETPFFDRVYRNHYGTRPVVLREDFCGTAAVCAEWVKSGSDRRAVGVDLDAGTLAWGEQHNLAPLTPQQRARVQLLCEDVRKVTPGSADVIAAQNFSYFCFKTRPELREYFAAAHANLADKGIFVLDIMGGSETQEDESEEITEFDDFDYVWEVASFDPVSYHVLCRIRFRFPDGSELKAFEYDWRHWTIPETRELLEEAGFSTTEVYWEGTDRATGEGNGIYTKRQRGEADPAWIAYVVAVK
jgi:hypothetical protein